MKYLALFLWPLWAFAIDYHIIYENDSVCVSRFKLYPSEMVDFHRDEYPHIVIAVKGGVIRRFEPDGSSTDVPLPTDQPVFRPVDPYKEGHRSLNLSDTESIEAYIIQLRSGN